MIIRILMAVLFVISCITAGFAADINGRWEGKIQGPDGDMQLTFTFKVEGNKLTGKVETSMGEFPITESSVTGDTFTFKTDAGGMVVDHQCKITGDTIAVKAKIGEQEIDLTLKRVQPPAEVKAPDLNGRWEGSVKGPDGNEFPLALVAKVEGNKLTGKVEAPWGEMLISDGVVKGNEFSFNIEIEGGKLTPQGKIVGDTLQMKTVYQQVTYEYTLKRVVAK
jgi:hypothetical protein